MRKLFLALLFVLLLIASVSAMVKTYEPDLNTITLGNGIDFLGMRLGWPEFLGGSGTSDFASYTQTYNTYYCDIHCEMDGITTLYQDGTLFDDMAFTNLNDGSSTNIQDVKYYYSNSTQTIDVSVTDYGNCTGTNETFISQCPIGSHTEQQEQDIWIEYTKGDILSANTYKWKILGTKDRFQSVDAIPISNGISFNEWSIWTSGLNVQIKNYYKLNESSGPVLDSVGNLNGTNEGAVTGVSGIIGNAYNFTGANDVDITQAGNFSGPNFTINLWINPSQTTYFQGIFGGGGATGPGCYAIYWDTTQGVVYGKRGASEWKSGVLFSKGQWQMLTFVRNDSGESFYRNGNYSASNTLADMYTCGSDYYLGQGSGQNGFEAIDEVGIWNRTLSASEISDLYNGGTGITFLNLFPTTISITYPISGSNYTYLPGQLNYSTNSLGVDCWASINNGATNTSHIACGTNFTGLTSIQGNNTWTVYANSTTQIQSSSNVMFTVDSINPNVTINSPNVANAINLGSNATINYTAADVNLQACWYSFNNAANVTTTCNTLIYLPINTFNNAITVYANDSFGNLNSSYVNWSYGAIINGVTYPNPEVIANSYNYVANISLSNTTFSNILLSWNYTNYTSIFTQDGFGNAIATNTIVPIKPGNISFYYIITASDGTVYNSNNFNVTVTSFTIDNCSTNSIIIANYTMLDQDTQNMINGGPENTTLEEYMAFSTAGSSYQQGIISTFNQSVRFTNPVLFCTSQNLTNVRFDSTTRIVSNGRVSEFYNIQNLTLNPGVTITKYLYDLNTSSSTAFNIIIKDQNFLPLQNALVDIQRQFLSIGNFLSVEIPITDTSGSTTGHFVTNNVIYGSPVYNLFIYKEGQLLKTIQNVQPVCNSGICNINLNLFGSGGNPTDFKTKDGVTYSMAFNSTSNTWTTTFSTLTGNNANMLMNVTLFDQYGNTTVCSKSLISSSGTMSCAVNTTSFGNATTVAVLYSNSNEIAQGFASIKQSASAIFGNTGIILTAFMFMTLTLLFMSSPVMIVIGGIMGIAIAGALNIYEGGSLFGIGSTIIYLIIAGGIILWKISKKQE